eukprot:gene11125-3944_t
MKLLGNESFFQCHETYNEYQNVQLVKLTGKITNKEFKKSVDFLLEKYELLQQVKNYKELFFASNYFEIERKNEKTWRNIFEDELANGSRNFIKMAHEINKKHNEYTFTCGLMWKIFLIYQENNDDFEVIISIDHTISDGLTICVLVGDLLSIIHKIQNNQEINEEFIKICPNLKDVFKHETVTKPMNLSGKLCGFKFDVDENQFEKIKQEVFFGEFDGDILMKLSKKNNVTINSTVAAAIFISYSNNFCKEEYEKFMRMMIPISVRKYAKLDTKSIGMLACFLHVEIEKKKEITEEYFWDIAKSIQNDVKNSITNKHYLNFIYWISSSSNSIDISNETVYNRDMRVLFSNRGKVDQYLGNSNFKIRGFHNSSDITTHGPNWLIHLATIQNRFFFTFSVRQQK